MLKTSICFSTYTYLMITGCTVYIRYSSSVTSRVLARLAQVTRSWLAIHTQGSRESQARLSRVTHSELAGIALAVCTRACTHESGSLFSVKQTSPLHLACCLSTKTVLQSIPTIDTFEFPTSDDLYGPTQYSMAGPVLKFN